MDVIKKPKFLFIFVLVLLFQNCKQIPKDNKQETIKSNINNKNEQRSLQAIPLTDTLYIKCDTGIINFINFHDAEDATQVFTKVDTVKSPFFHLIKATYYENIEFLLVNKSSGIIDTIFNEPIFSPNDSLFITLTPDSPYEGAIHGYEIWKLNNQNNLKQIKRTIQRNYHPLKANWINNSEVVLVIATMKLNEWDAATIDYNQIDTLKINL